MSDKLSKVITDLENSTSSTTGSETSEGSMATNQKFNNDVICDLPSLFETNVDNNFRNTKSSNVDQVDKRKLNDVIEISNSERNSFWVITIYRVIPVATQLINHHLRIIFLYPN